MSRLRIGSLRRSNVQLEVAQAGISLVGAGEPDEDAGVSVDKRRAGRLSLIAGVAAFVALVFDVVDLATGDRSVGIILMAAAMGLLTVTMTSRGLRHIRG